MAPSSSGSLLVTVLKPRDEDGMAGARRVRGAVAFSRQ
jgi:hypothetical protein